MSETRLLLCPFCGGKAVISCDTDAITDSEGRTWAYTAVCNSCCATSGLSYSAEKAIKAWNNRKLMQNIVERLEELKDKAVKKVEPKNVLEHIDFVEGVDKAIEIIKEEGGLHVG